MHVPPTSAVNIGRVIKGPPLRRRQDEVIEILLDAWRTQRRQRSEILRERALPPKDRRRRRRKRASKFFRRRFHNSHVQIEDSVIFIIYTSSRATAPVPRPCDLLSPSARSDCEHHRDCALNKHGATAEPPNEREPQPRAPSTGFNTHVVMERGRTTSTGFLL